MDILSIWPDTPEKLEKARARFERFDAFAARYRDDASLRARLDGGDTADALAEIGVHVPDGVEARIVVDTPGTVYFVMPPDPNVELADEALDMSGGGKTAGSGGTVGSFATAGCSCGPSTLSTAATAGSIGSAS